MGCLALIGLDGVLGSGNMLERAWSQEKRLRLNPDCALHWPHVPGQVAEVSIAFLTEHLGGLR